MAVDFDGTCVTHAFPNMGTDIGAAVVLKELVENGHRIILHTMRSGHRSTQPFNPLADAIGWFDKNEIPLFGINENPEQKSWTTSPKPYAHLYIDDAALGCPLIRLEGQRPFVNWLTVRLYLVWMGLLPKPQPW